MCTQRSAAAARCPVLARQAGDPPGACCARFHRQDVSIGRVESLIISSPAWWQLWLQCTLFAVIRARPSLTERAAQRACERVANRHERDHDGLAVWELALCAPRTTVRLVNFRCPARNS